jgi:hypothetical protein
MTRYQASALLAFTVNLDAIRGLVLGAQPAAGRQAA